MDRRRKPGMTARERAFMSNREENRHMNANSDVRKKENI